jgi:hypothetical protein
MAHALPTTDQQPLWIRHKTAVEEAEIHMGLKHREVENGVARIGRTVPDGIAREDFVGLWGNRFNQSTERLDDRLLLGWKVLQPGSNWFRGGCLRSCAHYTTTRSGHAPHLLAILNTIVVGLVARQGCANLAEARREFAYQLERAFSSSSAA